MNVHLREECDIRGLSIQLNYRWRKYSGGGNSIFQAAYFVGQECQGGCWGRCVFSNSMLLIHETTSSGKPYGTHSPSLCPARLPHFVSFLYITTTHFLSDFSVQLTKEVIAGIFRASPFLQLPFGTGKELLFYFFYTIISNGKKN